MTDRRKQPRRRSGGRRTEQTRGATQRETDGRRSSRRRLSIDQVVKPPSTSDVKKIIDALNAQLWWYARLADDRNRRLRELEAEKSRREMHS